MPPEVRRTLPAGKWLSALPTGSRASNIKHCLELRSPYQALANYLAVM